MVADQETCIRGAMRSAHTQETDGALARPGKAYPLSWFQQRLWFHYQRDPRSTSYNLPLFLLIRGQLDANALERSLSEIVARHGSLRTVYDETEDRQPVQSIQAEVPVSLPVLEVDHARMLSQIEEHLEHRFDLRSGPLFNARLLRLTESEHLLLFNVHHIAADAWSLRSVFLGELQSAYAAFCHDRQPTLAPLPVQYVQYASQQRARDLTSHLDYWCHTLEGYEDSLELPTTSLRQAKSGTQSAQFVHHYSSDFGLALERFSRQHGCTIFMSLLAALGVTLSRYTHKADLCIGTTSSNRSELELEPLIGFFINILPLRMQIDEQASVDSLLESVRASVLAAFEHTEAPFEQILHATGAGRRGSGNPLVPVILRHQNVPRAAALDSLPGGVEFGPYPEPGARGDAAAELLSRQRTPARCEIEMSYEGGGRELSVEVVYASDLYDRAAIERLLAHHERVLCAMFADSSQRVGALPLLLNTDVERLTEELNRAPTTPPPQWTFVQRFEAQLRRSGDAEACRDESGAAWTYLELAQRSDRVAQTLMERGTAPGSLVAVCLERSGSLLAALLGIWKAGAAYVPLDPDYPTAYLRQILDDTQPSAVLCSSALRDRLELDGARHLSLEDCWTAHANGTDPPPKLAPEPEALAYVMYTSGSTGKPKGVRVPHRQLSNWLSGLEAMLPFGEGEVVAQKTTFAFAVAVKELFAGLLNGCPQVFLKAETVLDVRAFVAALGQHAVSRLNLGPSHLASVLEHLESSEQHLPSLRVCITAGEPLPKAVVLAFRRLLPNARLLNNYGCTELNDICYYDTARFDGEREFVPIGTPIANTKVYVLDRKGRLVPEGAAGELHVASAGMPEGYQGREDLTAERFAPNPFGSEPSDLLYNTGDVVRYLPEGTLDFVGRWDFQVKVRGYRVDVRHVEKVLGDFPGIRARAVLGKGDRLLAFYTSGADGSVPVAELRAFLHQRLPAYMVPDTLVVLDAMPLLPNGKLNRRALMEWQGELQQGSEYEPPSTTTEYSLAAIWADVVRVPREQIGRYTSFFEVGGHSLSAMRVLARLKDVFGVELGVAQIFDEPRLESMAAAIDRQLTHLPVPKPQPYSLHATAPRQRKGSGLLSDKVALITGASRGIGLETALLFAEHGAQVAINYRDSEQQAQQAKELIEAQGGTAEIFKADVTQAADVAELVAAVRRRFERIDVLVANAHIHFRKLAFVEYEWSDLERKVNDELRAVFYPCQAVAEEMLARGSGSIVTVSSSLSKRSNRGFVAQSTAKAALDAFVRALAAELGPGGVRVNTVAPGLTLTDAAFPMSAADKASIARHCPMRRNGVAEDMAGAVLFLASDLARFMTGSYLPVDGGLTML